MLLESYYTFFSSKEPDKFIAMAKATGVDVDSIPEVELMYKAYK